MLLREVYICMYKCNRNNVYDIRAIFVRMHLTDYSF